MLTNTTQKEFDILGNPGKFTQDSQVPKQHIICLFFYKENAAQYFKMKTFLKMITLYTALDNTGAKLKNVQI